MNKKSQFSQWLNKKTNKYVKVNVLTNCIVTEKVTFGPYKNLPITTKKPTNKQLVEQKKKKRNYLNNKDMLAQLALSKQQDKMTNTLAHMLQTLAARYAKSKNFANYTYNDDMQAYAVMMLVKTWKSFNPERSQNPFSFFTQCIQNSFKQYLNQERRHRDIRDSILVQHGLDPSYTYQEAQSKKLKAELQK